MSTKKPLDLSTFDGKAMDGLLFCRRVYNLFEQVNKCPDSKARLRIRSQKLDKRLIEELIPLARYVQAQYQEGRRIKVQWFAGSQSYDAVLLSSGEKVIHGIAPKWLLIEITASYPDNDHFARRQLHEEGMTWGPKKISQDKKGKITSEPHVFINYERSEELAESIIKRIKDKTDKAYPPGTVLIINCFAGSGNLLLDDEWQRAVEIVKQAQVHSAFQEVFLIELVRSYSGTLYGNKAKRKQSETE